MDAHISTDTISSMIDMIQEKKDEFIMSQFEACGYSKQDVMLMMFNKRIRITREVLVISPYSEVLTYYVDHKPLFKIHDICNYKTESIELNVIDLASV